MYISYMKTYEVSRNIITKQKKVIKRIGHFSIPEHRSSLVALLTVSSKVSNWIFLGFELVHESVRNRLGSLKDGRLDTSGFLGPLAFSGSRQ